jgi:hypothetical protein
MLWAAGLSYLHSATVGPLIQLGQLPPAALLDHIPSAAGSSEPAGTQAAPNLVSLLPQPPATSSPNRLQLPGLASLAGTTSIPSAKVGTDPTQTSIITCDTGEPLPPKLAQKIREGQFVELHEFLPKSLLDAATTRTEHSCLCGHSNTLPRPMKTIKDIWSWHLCYNRYVAAVSTGHRASQSARHVSTHQHHSSGGSAIRRRWMEGL